MNVMNSEKLTALRASDPVLASQLEANPEAMAVVATIAAAKPEAWGDGTLIRIVLENLPQIMAMVKAFIEMFSKASPTPAPAPGPTA